MVGWGCKSSPCSPTGFFYANGVYTEILPPGWEISLAQEINNNGVIVGYGEESAGVSTNSFFYSNGKYDELFLYGGWSDINAFSINDKNEIVGQLWDRNSRLGKGFLYSNNSYTELLPPNWDWAVARDINESGVIVGYGSDGSTYTKGFVATVVTEPISSILFIVGGAVLAGKRYLRKRRNA